MSDIVSDLLVPIITLITGVAGTHLVNKRQARKLDSQDRRDVDDMVRGVIGEYKEIIDQLKDRVDALEAQNQSQETKIEKLTQEHQDCHAQLAELKAQLSNDLTLRDFKS